MDENTKFQFNNQDTDMTMLDFWKFQFSEIYDKQGEIAEFIVAKALKQDTAYNKTEWTLFDIEYRNTPIEVKETSYFHAWQSDEEPKSKSRVFSIKKANSNAESKNKNKPNEYKRHSKIYVFCLNTGFTRAEAYPLNLNNWEFYIVPTSVIDEKCKENKTISLSRIKKLGYKPLQYDCIKNEIDYLIDNVIDKK